jgi:hypothetical protein
MHYFDKVKVGEEVFSLVFGKGLVVVVLPKKQRVEGFYVFAVEYANDKKVHYTLDGFPNWCSSDGCMQTVFYLKDVDLTDMEIQACCTILSEKKILKYKEKGNLEIRCPSGIWRNADEVPEKIVKKALKNDSYHLFRKEAKS